MSSSSGSRPEPADRPDSPPGTLDLRGEVCPFTFVRTRLALEALPVGARLRVLVDHASAARNVPRSARDWGQDVAPVTEIEPGLWAIELRKRVE